MKHILVVFFIVHSKPVFAQFSKGDKAVSGELSIMIKRTPVSSRGDSIKHNTDVGFYPKLGIFVNKNLEIGGMLGYSYGRETISHAAGYKFSSHGFSVGLYENKYFQITEKFFFSLLGKAEYHHIKYFWKASNYQGSQLSNRDINVNFSPNLILFPASNWALTANLGGVEYSYKIEPQTSKIHVFSIALGQNFIFGLSYYFRK